MAGPVRPRNRTTSWVVTSRAGAHLVRDALVVHDRRAAPAVRAQGALPRIPRSCHGLLVSQLVTFAHSLVPARGVHEAAEQRVAIAQDLDRAALGHLLARLLARVFEQRVRDLVAHDLRDFVVVELELDQDAVEERDLAAGHAERVDLVRPDQVDLPAPFARARVALPGERDDAVGDVAQPLDLRVLDRPERTLAARLLQQAVVLLRRRLLDLLGRHQPGELRAPAFR